MNSNKIHLVILLLASACRCLCQDSLSHFSMPYAEGRLIIGPFTTATSFQSFALNPGVIGVDSEYMVGRNVGFGAVVAGGYNYAEVSASILGLFGLASWHSNNDGLWWLFAFTPLVLENPCFHFNPSRNQEFVLSVSALRFRYLYDRNPEYGNDLFASGSIAIRYSIFHKAHWQWSFYTEYVSLYHSGRPKGLQVGVALRHVSRRSIK